MSVLMEVNGDVVGHIYTLMVWFGEGIGRFAVNCTDWVGAVALVEPMITPGRLLAEVASNASEVGCRGLGY